MWTLPEVSIAPRIVHITGPHSFCPLTHIALPHSQKTMKGGVLQYYKQKVFSLLSSFWLNTNFYFFHINSMCGTINSDFTVIICKCIDKTKCFGNTYLLDGNEVFHFSTYISRLNKKAELSFYVRAILDHTTSSTIKFCLFALDTLLVFWYINVPCI